MPERTFFAMPYPGIFRVTMPLPIPGLSHVHTYFAEGPGGGLVMIDTGMPYKDSRERIEQGVRWLGRDVTDIERIVLTHAHPDHIGMAKDFQDASGAPVSCHPIAHRMFVAMQDPGGFVRMMAGLAEFGWQRDEEFANAPPPFTMPLPEGTIDHVEEGDTIELAGGAWDVYWTPGHEWGHVVFHRASDGVLISGDTVLGKITPHVGWHGEPEDPLGQFIDSLDKVAALKPSFVIPGHGRSFEDGAERAMVIKSHHRIRLRQCHEILMRRARQNALEVAREIFGRDLLFFQERLALAETLAHLEYLRLRGRIEREKIDGIWVYSDPKGIVP